MALSPRVPFNPFIPVSQGTLCVQSREASPTVHFPSLGLEQKYCPEKNKSGLSLDGELHHCMHVPLKWNLNMDDSLWLRAF